MGKASYKRYTCVGPGGRKCSCCYPPPGAARRKAERRFKKRELREAQKEVLTEDVKS